MARTLAFDRAEVVRQARAVFWSRGYESAAIPELEAATGLSRSSIYNSFGSKRGLFDAAVDSYLDEVVRPRLAALAGGDVAAQTLDEYLAATQAIFQKPESLPAANGCLLINSANAPIASDEHVSQAIYTYRGELHAAFSRGLQAAVPGLADQRLALLADAVTGLVVAAFALVRISPAEAARLVESARRLARAQA